MKLTRPGAKMLAPIQGSNDYQSWVISNNLTNFLTLNRVPSSNDAVLVTIDGTFQQPGTAFSIVDNQLLFSEYLPKGSNVGILYLNREYFYTGAVANGSVSSASIVAGGVTNSNILDGAVSGNKIAQFTITANNIVADTVSTKAIFNQIRQSASAPPANGTYQRGDIVWNSHPISGSYIGWICTGDGTPGIWTTFGLIS